MSQRLIIALGNNPTAPWWWQCGEQAAMQARTPEDKAALAHLDAKPIIAIMAGQAIRTIPIDLPAMRPSERQKAAALFIEDHIATSLNNQHILLSDTEPAYISLTSRNKLQKLLEALKAYSLTPNIVYADFDCLAQTQQSYQLDDRLLYTGGLGYSLDTDSPLQAHDPHMQTPKSLSWTDFFNLATKPEALNLLQGEFAPQRPYRLNKALAQRFILSGAACLFAYILLLWAQTTAYQKQTQHLHTDMRHLYSQVSGDAGSQTPVLSLRRNINKQVQQVDFLTLSQILFEAIESVAGIEIENLQYEAQKAQLSLRLSYPGFETAPAFEQAAQKIGAKVQTGSVREQDGRFIGQALFSLQEAQP